MPQAIPLRIAGSDYSQPHGLVGIARIVREVTRLHSAKGRKQFTVYLKEVITMREGIHPKYYQATVTCNCGNTFTTGSTKPEIHVEICSACHSFYTGQQKAAQIRGRIDKFNRKYGLSQNN